MSAFGREDLVAVAERCGELEVFETSPVLTLFKCHSNIGNQHFFTFHIFEGYVETDTGEAVSCKVLDLKRHRLFWSG